MGDLIEGDDKLPAEEVGGWAREKQAYLCRYIDISRGVRAKYLAPQGAGGACYIDLFCGPGRSLVKDTGEWIDGSPVAAWKKSCEGGAPFSKVIIADLDKDRLEAATTRLKEMGAPVFPIHGPANETAARALQQSAVHGLNFAFLDPFNIGALNFEIFKTLSRLKRIDILAHISKMDLQRNLSINVAAEISQFDQFAPGWRHAVDLKQQQPTIRRDVMEYWRKSVASTGIATSEDTTLITGSKGQHLYWLLLAAKHDLAHKFWKVSSKKDQGTFDF
ncbi:three-Cys-motif partner protein TcmP [Tianweitania sp.]|uniref:three-Cys-motif partner protein TcmP n=1 Tax=Tianweitania sp. TaxID=2021634 RepID=UPI0028988BFC|nr:three-Cys-motif partner protein TcmP [Tianweitania sp.]